jgi:hypothetical protein
MNSPCPRCIGHKAIDLYVVHSNGMVGQYRIDCPSCAGKGVVKDDAELDRIAMEMLCTMALRAILVKRVRRHFPQAQDNAEVVIVHKEL